MFKLKILLDIKLRKKFVACVILIYIVRFNLIFTLNLHNLFFYLFVFYAFLCVLFHFLASFRLFLRFYSCIIRN